jgi:hypothetical protein
MATQEDGRPKICVAMVCDFFFPRLGGVENHIYQLAQCLLMRGLKVIVITHSYGDRNGVRFLTNGLKVYYIPSVVIVEGSTPPVFWLSFPLLRSIVVREGVTLIHGHQSTSSLSSECMMHAKTMGTSSLSAFLFPPAQRSAAFQNDSSPLPQLPPQCDAMCSSPPQAYVPSSLTTRSSPWTATSAPSA